MKSLFKTGGFPFIFEFKHNVTLLVSTVIGKKYSWKFSPISTHFGSQIIPLRRVDEEPVLMSWSLTNTNPDSLYKARVSLHPLLQVLLTPTNTAALQGTTWTTQPRQPWLRALGQIRLLCTNYTRSQEQTRARCGEYCANLNLYCPKP